MNFNAVLVIFLFELFVFVASIGLLIIYFRDLQTNTTKMASKLSCAAACIFILSFLALLVSNRSFDPHTVHIDYVIARIGFCIGALILIITQFKVVSANSQRTKPEAVSNHDEKEATQSSPPSDTLDVYHQIFQGGPASFLIVDSEQKIVKANNCAAELLQVSATKLIDRSLSSLTLLEDQWILKNLNLEKLASKKQGGELEIRLNLVDGEPRWIKIIPQLLGTNNKNILLLIQDISESKSLAELLAFHSQYDELTMLHNRSGLEKYLIDSLKSRRNKASPIALIYIDIDQLKVVNDTCGHSAGDSLIQQLVTIIGDVARSCDFFARLGGDEFALVKCDCTEGEAQKMAESVRCAAEDFIFIWKNNHYRQSVSIGVAITSPKLSDVVGLIGAADSACYTAKKNGRNRVIMYADDSNQTSYDSHKEVMWVSRLQKAIQKGAFILYFQPIEKLNSGNDAHIHYELLIRYIDDNGEHISPAHFLPAVERFGLSEQIDLWVLTTALDYLHKHPDHTEKLDCCSINLTSQSIANPRIRSAIIQVVQSYGFPRNKICFEITESSAIHNLSEAQEFVKELKMLGCHLALDDFGTGFSSFDYLKHLEVDYIKIDGSFVRDIITDRFDRAMVSAINNIGKEMGIEIIAEYAENAKILSTLKSMNIDYAQGYAIAKPRPIDELESYYAKKLTFPQKAEAN